MLWLFDARWSLRVLRVFPHMQKIEIIQSPKPKRSETDIIKHYPSLQ